MVRVKICGMTSIREVNLAKRYGADAIGVLVGQLHHATDFVSLEVARRICKAIPPFITPVLVTHLENEEEIIDLAEQIPCTVIQLHSDLSPKLLRELSLRLQPRRILSKVSVEGEIAIRRARELYGVVNAIVLDSIDVSADRVGGTGMVHDWRISAQIVKESTVPVILAGGLTPTNVREAIMQVKPWGVDVNSGVETPDGRKSGILIREFIKVVRSIP